MKNLSESFRKMHENSVQYYKQKANEELDKMEKTYNQVINWVLLTKSYWQTHTYHSLQPFNFLINYTVISLKTNLYSKFLSKNNIKSLIMIWFLM
jgi:hypothetical protein